MLINQADAINFSVLAFQMRFTPDAGFDTIDVIPFIFPVEKRLTYFSDSHIIIARDRQRRVPV